MSQRISSSDIKRSIPVLNIPPVSLEDSKISTTNSDNVILDRGISPQDNTSHFSDGLPERNRTISIDNTILSHTTSPIKPEKNEGSEQKVPPRKGSISSFYLTRAVKNSNALVWNLANSKQQS